MYPHIDREPPTHLNPIMPTRTRRVKAVAGLTQSSGDTHSSERALRESEARLQLALDAANLGLWQYNVEEGTVSWDARFKVMFDVKMDAAPIDEIILRLLPEDIPRVQLALAAASDAIDPKPYHVRYRIQQTDGAIRWIEAHGITDFEGEANDRRAVRLVGTVCDVTAVKRQEEHLQLLMRELAHRGKNVMSVVQSIARLTEKEGHADFASRFSDRIAALAASQDVVVNGDWHNVDVHDLVRSQLAHFKDMFDTRIVVEGERMNIAPAAAQTLGMALHELATNASKYGSLSDEHGQITIRWRLIDVGGGDQFEIHWVEQNGPSVVPPTRRGFGTTVVEVMAKSALSATVELTYPSTGVEWRLTCPADCVCTTEPPNFDRTSAAVV